MTAPHDAASFPFGGGPLLGAPSHRATFCLSAEDWLKRDIPAPEFLLGQWLSTTSRALLVAPTGIGKTNFGMAIGFSIAAGADFLHWRCSRPARVLFVDGEMSRRLLKRRIEDAARRVGSVPPGFFALCRDDIEDLPPLDTEEGQSFVDRVLHSIGGAHLIILDNVMSLTAGDMKDEESWQRTLPWIRTLTQRSIGQVWVHHTGHDESRAYGTKTREWMLDTVVMLETIQRPGSDIAFSLKFTKARERTPTNRADFEPAIVTLEGDRWLSDRQSAAPTVKKLSPKGKVFHEALIDALAAAGVERTESAGLPSVTVETWKAECRRKGLLDPSRPKPESATFSKYRLELVASKAVICNGDYAWNGMVAR